MKSLLLISTIVMFSMPLQAGVTCRTDAWGNTTCHGTGNDRGYNSTTRTDAWGNTSTTDNRGNTVNCRTDAWGNTTCN